MTERRREETKEQPKKMTNGSIKTDSQSLLESANSASERVAGLHVAFMAVCVYILVIVFSTTDVDILKGKGVSLAVVNVEVPIVGFYTFAPFIIVLVHFNLLLQLQLLSRKLFALEAATPQDEGIGGLRDRLHIFPYTYYLVGKPGPLVHSMIGLMVSMTVVLLPLVTLLALQLQFLAYQSETVTWWQRTATWLDLTTIFMLWPIILHPSDDWRDYWRQIRNSCIPRPRVWAGFALLVTGLVLVLFGAEYGAVLIGLCLLLFTPPALIFIYGRKNIPFSRKGLLIAAFAGSILSLLISYFTNSTAFELIGPMLIATLVVFWHPDAPRGSLALLFTLCIGSMVPAALLVDGETWEKIALSIQRTSHTGTVLSESLLAQKRVLRLDEQVLLAKPPAPETLATIRSEKWQNAIRQLEPLNLRGRNLRHARLSKAVLIGADLRDANLQGAYLGEAQLQNADLQGAQLQVARLLNARLQGARLKEARLQGADLESALLQNADLEDAEVQGALLSYSRLEGADLGDAQLQGTDLCYSHLDGAKLDGAQFQGADLRGAVFANTALRYAQLQGADLRDVLVDKNKSKPSFGRLLRVKLGRTALSGTVLRVFVSKLQAIAGCPSFLKRDLYKQQRKTDEPKIQVEACLSEDNSLNICAGRINPGKKEELQKYTEQLHSYLGQLACESPEIANGLISQVLLAKYRISGNSISTRKGLQIELQRLRGNKGCEGLYNLGEQTWEALAKSSENP